MADLFSQIDLANELFARSEEVLRPIREHEGRGPTNFRRERERFLAGYESGRVESPSFEYEPQPDFSREAEALDLLRSDCLAMSSPIGDRLALAIEAHLRSIRGTRHDPGDITQQTQDLYGVPSQELVAIAWGLLETAAHDVSTSQEFIGAEAVANTFRSVLTGLGATRWRVEVVDDMAARISVSGPLGRIRVRTDAVLSVAEVRRLVVHEIGTHVARSEAGLRQPLRSLSVGLPGYLLAEEGLAVYHEDRFDCRTPSSTATYAARVIAAHLALDHGFREVFQVVVGYVGAPQAFDIVARSKRGFEDTERLGCHLKDIVYLAGMLRVRETERDGMANPRLYVGKTSFEDFDLIDELEAAGAMSLPEFGPVEALRLLDESM